MERTFKKITLSGLGYRAVAMQITVPFTIFLIGEMGISPVADLPVHSKIFFIMSRLIGIKSSNNRFGLRPPEFHILRIILRREMTAIPEINYASIFFVPAPFPRPIKNLQRHLHQLLIPITKAGFLQNEPRSLDAMPRIDDPTVASINKLPILTYRFQ